MWGAGPPEAELAVQYAAPIRPHLLPIGRLRRGPLYDLQSYYAGRIVPPAAIIELEEKRRLPPAELKAREAELILPALPAGGRPLGVDHSRAPRAGREIP